MYTISAGSQRNIGSFIYEDFRRTTAANCDNLARELINVAGGKIFFANLDEFDSQVNLPLDGVQQTWKATAEAAIRDEIAKHFLQYGLIANKPCSATLL
jgi:small nuclear ribonucleoprotein (snRNP)-like protein